MIHEMHEEEEVDTSIGTVEKTQPSSLPIVREAISPVGGTLADVQDVPEIQLIQVLHISSSHIISVPHIEICDTMPSGQVHNQGLEHLSDLEQQIITA